MIILPTQNLGSYTERLYYIILLKPIHFPHIFVQKICKHQVVLHLFHKIHKAFTCFATFQNQGTQYV